MGNMGVREGFADVLRGGGEEEGVAEGRGAILGPYAEYLQGFWRRRGWNVANRFSRGIPSQKSISLFFLLPRRICNRFTGAKSLGRCHFCAVLMSSRNSDSTPART